MKNVTKKFYRRLIQQIRPQLDGWEFPCLGPFHKDLLEVSTEKEVLEALTSYSGETKGTDGFTTSFLQHNCDVLKDDVTGLFEDLSETSLLVKSLILIFFS